MDDPYDLERFVSKQGPIYEQVLSELRGGRKITHWMWFIFPQIRGLGRSALSVRFSMADRPEASAYLSHAVLGPRLRECTELVNKSGARSIEEVFHYPDDLKFRSSMTLFDVVEPGSVFSDALKRFFGGDGDPATLEALKITGAGKHHRRRS